jgi:ABC-type nitrate/sulfonate/bicarbonate transport system permease component
MSAQAPIAQTPSLPLYLPGIRPNRLQRLRSLIGWNGAVILEVIILIAVWEFAVKGLELWNPRFVPPPSDIADSLGRMIQNGSLARHLGYSGGNFVVGYLAAAFFGVTLGFAIGSFRTVRAALGPFLWLAYATPRVAIQPILVLWMGFGVAPKILIIFLMAFFPIVITVMEGVRNTDPSLLRASRVFGVRGVRRYTKVVLPASLPYVLTGLRLGIARALVGVVVGEFIGGTAGLGFAIRLAGQEFHVDTALAVTLVLVVIANVSMLLLLALKRRLAPWDEEVSPRLR